MTRLLPILPLRDIVVFPQRIVPLFVGREKSVAALEAAMTADKELFLVAQLDPAEDDPDRDALYDLGVVATAMQLLKLPDGTVRVLVEGVKRARLVGLVPADGYMTAGNPWFERIAAVPARFNRLIVYPGSVFHGADIQSPERLDPDPRAGRLTMNGFFVCRRRL